MSKPVVADIPPFLSEISERDANWEIKKAQAKYIAQLYRDTEFNRLFERINHCSDRLLFGLHPGENEVKLKLKSTRLCRVRHCPICQWRRQSMWFKRFVSVLPKILEDYPSARFIMLTLTVQNCEVGDLRSTLTEMNRAWQRLTQRKQFKPVLGWVKSVEFTRNNDSKSPWFDTAHPHFHALLMVKPSYFGSSYVSHAQWVQTWRECLRVNYDPSVRVQTIKPKNPLPRSVTRSLPASPLPPNAVPVSLNSDGTMKPVTLPQDLVSGVSEVVKYTVKPSDLAIGGKWLLTLTEQLRGTKAIALGGLMRDYLKEPDESNEELIASGLELDDGAVEDVAPVLVAFGWREKLKRYQQVEGA